MCLKVMVEDTGMKPLSNAEILDYFCGANKLQEDKIASEITTCKAASINVPVKDNLFMSNGMVLNTINLDSASAE